MVVELCNQLENERTYRAWIQNRTPPAFSIATQEYNSTNGWVVVSFEDLLEGLSRNKPYPCRAGGRRSSVSTGRRFRRKRALKHKRAASPFYNPCQESESPLVEGSVVPPQIRGLGVCRTRCVGTNMALNLVALLRLLTAIFLLRQSRDVVDAVKEPTVLGRGHVGPRDQLK